MSIETDASFWRQITEWAWPIIAALGVISGWLIKDKLHHIDGKVNDALPRVDFDRHLDEHDRSEDKMDKKIDKIFEKIDTLTMLIVNRNNHPTGSHVPYRSEVRGEDRG